jgi:hypothetical protein
MSNPTTPFGWQMPTATDLVTDLPADFEVFGQAVATSMADLLGGTTGQVLSKTSNTDMDFTWTSPNPGDITGVTAGTGISGGGTSGDVTITNSMATAIDAKGDLIAGTGADAFSRLAVGSNDQVLLADSTAATGLKWGAAPAGGMTSLASGTLGSSGTTISSISGSYKNLQLVLRGVLNTSDNNGIRLNGDTSSNYRVSIAETGATSLQGGAQTTYYNTFVNSSVIAIGHNIFFYDYTNSSNKKQIVSYAVRDNTAVAGTGFYGGTTAAITSITIFPISGTITAGTYELFGVK